MMDMDDRAVSEVVGFAIVFGIIIGSVGLLYVVGFQAMVDYTGSEQMRNAERAFDVMAENFNDVQHNDGVTARSSEINLRGGTIRAGSDGTVVSISDTEDTLNNSNLPDTEEIGAFTYVKDDTTIAYHGGGVFRAQPEGNVAVTDPPMTCRDVGGDDVAIVSLVVVEGDGGSLGSSDVQEITATQRGNATVETGSGGVNISIEIANSPYQDAWNRALERNGWDGSGGDYYCDVERATIRITTVEIDYN